MDHKHHHPSSIDSPNNNKLIQSFPTHHADSNQHAGHNVEMFRNKFWICLIISIPVLICDPMIQQWFKYQLPSFPGSNFISAIFGTFVFIYGGWIFLQGAYRELANKTPGMMTLIALAINVAFFYSIAVMLGLKGHPLWWELATLVTIMLLGHWIEMRSISQAQGALQELAKLLPDTTVLLMDDESTQVIPVNQLREGDFILIRPGASIPADGIIQSGKSSVNEAMITGESKPVEKKQGEKVIAGTVNGEGSLRVKVIGIGNNTALAGIMRLVEQAQSSRSRAQVLADRAAFYLTLVAIGSGLITLIGWLLFGSTLDFAITRTVTVLVIACPHALGLAIPLVIAISTTLGARNGLLIRNRRGLEEARNLNIVVFDKTGTLTMGEHRVVQTVTDSNFDKKEVLRLAAAVERDSEHPIGRALQKSAEAIGIEIPSSQNFRSIPGQGVQAQVEGREFQVGGPSLLKGKNFSIPKEFNSPIHHYNESGYTATYLIEGEKVLAVFAIADAIRPESNEAIQSLNQLGIQSAMLTGDSKAVAEIVAKELGINLVFAQVLPEDKAKKIQDLQKQGKRVAMVGDGLNDAPALATADVSIAIGAGTDVAVEAGDVVLIRSDPRDIPRIIKLSKATYRKMIQNLWWAAGYNIIALPLAAGALAWAGIILPPAIGAVLMSLSTVIVSINAQLLKRIKL